MYLRRTTRRVGGKTYHNYLLVESVTTPKGPRQRVICSLGALAPGLKAEWLGTARRLHAALAGQTTLLPDARVDALAARARPPRRAPAAGPGVTIDPEGVTFEEEREAGPVHVGHQMWRLLRLDTILAGAGLSARAQLLTEVMTLNRLVSPASEHAMPDWIRRTALADILGTAFSTLSDEARYRNLDRLHPQRAAIEQALAARERTLFTLEDTLYLYDLTSTYFEGRCPYNPQAKRGYSRDHRPDCKQVVIGLVLDRDGFPKAHEVFDGNRQDQTTVEDMLTRLEERTGRRGGATVVVDRGMAFAANLAQIRARGHHYLVAARYPERGAHHDAFAADADWTEVIRVPSPRNPGQKKTRVLIKRQTVGDEVHILCRSDARIDKDRAIRDKHEQRLLADLQKLQTRVAHGRLRDAAKIQEAIGRLKERYSRVARYYVISYDAATSAVSWTEQADKKAAASALDGTYLLKTDRQDLADDEVWRLYILLTRVEAAFRALKSPLMERPIFHHLEQRVQTHIFLCVLAYHLLVAIEKRCLDHGWHTSWATLREQLSTHQVATVVLPAVDGRILKIRKGSTPDDVHREIYRVLQIPHEVMKPVKTWSTSR
ncbi:MAG: IS1634 family transposase [Candidatus Rokubacteria bacterium]|nr:IS1634 family transposase [Candidatus Rokubacteria bacterium]